MPTIGVLHTNAGNVSSLMSCCRQMGYQPVLLTEPAADEVDVLMIPGQGHFGEVMDYLRSRQLDSLIHRHIANHRTVIGICVGMQIFFEGSEEAPGSQGLGLFPGVAGKLNSPKQPMVGWATLYSDKDINNAQVYFVNSYAVKPSPALSAVTLAGTHYGEDFVAAVQGHKRPNLIGFQFHPEKSGQTGKRILQKAIEQNFQPIPKKTGGTAPANRLCPRVIACLDVADGRVVKGTRFVDIKDMGDPVALAAKYEQQGADEILYLDITATNEQRKNALHTVQSVAAQLSIPLTVGGGLNATEDVAAFLNAGADKIALNTAAVHNPQLVNDIAGRFGSQCVVVAIDTQLENGRYVVYTHGGKKATTLEALTWAKQVADLGAGELLITAKHRDGTGLGFDNELMREMAKLPIQVIASGGAANARHFAQTFAAGSDAALAAGMFHRGEISITELKETLLKQQIKVRKVC